ncbi:MAG TPA: divalent-cation tolerance protein CutA [Methylomirabilota bacterium]|nr:divalent-cation tolerance protein CutA [Methylomirabilota bacterium]
MKTGSNCFVVLVTAPDLKVARRLALGALREKLVACANLIPKVESHYWWQGKVESSAEVLLVFKTTQPKVRAFEQFILANHPYETPEFIALSVASGTKRYLDWISASAR